MVFKRIKSLFKDDQEIYKIPKESIFDSLNIESSVQEIHKKLSELYDGKHLQTVIVKLIDDIVYEINKFKWK